MPWFKNLITREHARKASNILSENRLEFSLTCLGRSQYPIYDAGMELCLICLHNEAICESVFGREDSAGLELIVMFQAAGVPSHYIQTYTDD
jgi:hypothetical protein